ncbi:TniB family NTP-binding protein [Pseudomonas grandcourensis]|uniref:TniB family NTP-binding protein n=1 Tax=Pseudomonas grandcourensis TaxID=3136736 RepID=UPI00326582DB
MKFLSAQEVLMHAHFSAAYDRAHQVVARGLEGENLILMMLAPTRTGKSELIRLLQADHPSFTSEGRRSIPVLRVATPVNPTRKSLPEAMLASLDPRKYGRGSAEQLTQRACGLIELAGTRVVIFDEIQHFIERPSRALAREVADWLKLLSEEMGLTILMLGLPSARAIFAGNEQLRDRAEAVHYLYPYRWNDPQERALFQNCVLTLCGALTQAGWHVPDVKSLDFIRRLYASTQGRIGMLIKLFCAAEANAKALRLDLSTFSGAYAKSIGTGLIDCNPFDPGSQLDDSVLVQAYVKVLTEAQMPLPKASLIGLQAGRGWS